MTVEAGALRSVEELTPWWCNEALAPSGIGRVDSCHAAPIGAGHVADTFRVELSYESRAAGPPSLVMKIGARSAASRAAAKVSRAYEVEVAFYRDLAPTLAVRTPRCYYATHDTSSGAYTVLLEDLRAARHGSQLDGCTPSEVAAAVEEMAKLHASRWGDPALEAVTWLHRHEEPAVAHMARLVAKIAPGFLRRYGERLEDDVVALVERFPSLVTPYLRDRQGARTVVHGDFRADNLLFGDGGVTVVDWQTAGQEPGVTDLSYFMGASVPTAVRHEIERDIVDLYRAVLRSSGVRLSRDEIWAAYRRYALGGLLMAIAASMLVTRTERGDAMFVVMAQSHGRHVLDLEAESLFTTA